ncbi:PIGMENT DEFECTIVE 331 [Hibiscus trionum]|uniref:PIGMENT DEFECTIVE 331 n=1 Tax=Hibiscus trionum TaxID=183268 RepID=A0A9W7MSA2_HIBTR|nr:PIGMENT DEFECTIVE 331 [Hibiscus trionum]
METIPPPPTAVPSLPSAINTSAVPATYAGSIDSTPRSRHTDSRDDPPPAVHSKLRLMCSYGGTIFPRPHDKTLSYIGGDTRMVVVDRHSSLVSLHHRLSHSLLHGRPFTLKYQLPSEELDSLISVTTDEDLENMIEEYDRTCSQTTSSSKSSRIRLFLFPASSHSIGPIINNSTKSDEWFLNALNGTALPNRGFSDSATNVNCLLGLDDDRQGNVGETGSQKNMNLKNQDVHSVPDSPMLETNSSFGSTSSSPSLANLPPIRVRHEDQKEHKLAGMFKYLRPAAGGGMKQQDERSSPPIVQMSSGSTNRAPANPVDPNTTNQPVQDSGYILQQQQFLHAGAAHYIQQQQYPLYYVPARQSQAYNLPVKQPSSEAATAIPSSRPQTPPLAYNHMRNVPIAKSEMAAATDTPQLIQVPNNQQHQQQYTVVPTSAATATYYYEFVDPARAQIYYTQPLPPTIPSQYQTMTAASAVVLPDANAQRPIDNVKQNLAADINQSRRKQTTIL